MKKKILDFILKRFTDYYNILEENKGLKQDIYHLVKESNSEKGTLTKMKYEIEFNLNNAVWFGGVGLSEEIDKETFEGIWELASKLSKPE